eukprot:g48114.t1
MTFPTISESFARICPTANLALALSKALPWPTAHLKHEPALTGDVSVKLNCRLTESSRHFTVPGLARHSPARRECQILVNDTASARANKMRSRDASGPGQGRPCDRMIG